MVKLNNYYNDSEMRVDYSVYLSSHREDMMPPISPVIAPYKRKKGI